MSYAYRMVPNIITTNKVRHINYTQKDGQHPTKTHKHQTKSKNPVHIELGFNRGHTELKYTEN
jgi:hypothetical protein